MVYIDEHGNPIERFDLTRGCLVEAGWEEHPAVEEVGHYAYEALEGGGQMQKYIVDTPYSPAWREVTVMQYLAYTQEQLDAMAKADYNGRLDALEAETQAQRDALEAIAGGVADA